MESKPEVRDGDESTDPQLRPPTQQPRDSSRESQYSEVLLVDDEPTAEEGSPDVTNAPSADQEPRVTIHATTCQSTDGPPVGNSRSSGGSGTRVSSNHHGDENQQQEKQQQQQLEENKSLSGSSASSPVPPSPHKTRFTVSVRHAKECTGDIITYLVSSRRLFDDKQAGNEGRTYQVMRVYEDFEFLDQCLVMAAFAGQSPLSRFPPSLPPASVCLSCLHDSTPFP